VRGEVDGAGVAAGGEEGRGSSRGDVACERAGVPNWHDAGAREAVYPDLNARSSEGSCVKRGKVGVAVIVVWCGVWLLGGGGQVVAGSGA
jgi:hypothetical protein